MEENEYNGLIVRKTLMKKMHFGLSAYFVDIKQAFAVSPLLHGRKLANMQVPDVKNSALSTDDRVIPFNGVRIDTGANRTSVISTE